MIYFGEDKMPDFCNRSYPFHYATALNLLEKMGININRINILAIGEHENYKGEILGQRPAPGSPLKSDTRIELNVGYPSAVDQLPFQFFYGLGGKTHRSADWELHSRHFMAPYDAAVIRHNASARYQALRFSFGITDKSHLARYLSLFDFALEHDFQDLSDAVFWTAIMPSFHIWSGNSAGVTEILQFLFGYRFRIVENIESKYEIPEEIRYRLGSRSGRLGRESIVGRAFCECDSTYQLIVAGISRQEMAEFIPGGPKRLKLERVLEICMPNELDYRITFEVENRAVILGSKKEGAYLGHSTHLQRVEDRRRHQRLAENIAMQ
jgi:hypothetical protein